MLGQPWSIYVSAATLLINSSQRHKTRTVMQKRNRIDPHSIPTFPSLTAGRPNCGTPSFTLRVGTRLAPFSVHSAIRRFQKPSMLLPATSENIPDSSSPY